MRRHPEQCPRCHSRAVIGDMERHGMTARCLACSWRTPMAMTPYTVEMERESQRIAVLMGKQIAAKNRLEFEHA